MTATTASTTHSSSALSRFLFLLVLALAGTWAHAEGIEVKTASLEARSGGYELDADFEIALSPTLEDILGKGVPLNFLLEFELYRPRWYWLNEKLATFSQQYKLSYNALTRQYRLSLGTLYQNFATLREAVAFMSRLRGARVVEQGEIRRDTPYVAAVRLRLDVSQLPKPFQIAALGSREWNMSSEWYRFPVSATETP